MDSLLHAITVLNGLGASAQGQDRSANPHPEASAGHAAWLSGWQQGRAWGGAPEPLAKPRLVRRAAAAPVPAAGPQPRTAGRMLVRPG